ncbi:uncharacterized protein LOC111620103 [Centruroides sculpturatus]|uniref:uncharacterized protein LOC111620103 n=1 Tax=Centruroides sculpturatus TaxID=218467 RepID=UPI000C6E3059|nr:uncharacterized protein LOC111620103 [Centruroides sculpturatus]
MAMNLSILLTIGRCCAKLVIRMEQNEVVQEENQESRLQRCFRRLLNWKSTYHFIFVYFPVTLVVLCAFLYFGLVLRNQYLKAFLLALFCFPFIVIACNMIYACIKEFSPQWARRFYNANPEPAVEYVMEADSVRVREHPVQ